MDASEKIDIIKKYIKSKTLSSSSEADIGIASEMDLEYSFVEPPIPSLSRLLARTDESRGGFPKGKYSVVAGPERCSKSTLCLQTIAFDMEQDVDAVWCWIDTENSFDEKYAEYLGIDMSRLVLIKNGVMEDVLQRIIDLSKAQAVTGVVIDSVGALTPKEEVANSKGEEKTLDQDSMLNLQRRLGQFYRMSNSFVARAKCAVIQIGHVYQSPDSYGAYVVKGGNALKHWCHVRLMMNRLKDLSTKEKVIMAGGDEESIMTGHNVRITLEKTRQNNMEGQYVVVPYRYGVGLDSRASTISMAINHGIITKSGPWMTYKDQKFMGKKQIEIALAEDPKLYDAIVSELFSLLEDK
jgi:recombination protein RecA